MVYEGEFKRNAADGEGKITYLDTGNTFECLFQQNQKSGPCRFIVRKGEAELAVFYGEFANNLEKFESSNYGKRV